QRAGVQGGGEERRPSAYVRADEMRTVQPPRVDEPDDELAHRLRMQEVVPPLRAAKAWQVDGTEVRELGEPLPDRPERIQAFRPWIRQQDRLVVVSIALGVADAESVHGSELDPHGLACWHGHPYYSLVEM